MSMADCRILQPVMTHDTEPAHVRLRRIREKRGLSQYEAGAELQVWQGNLSKIENGLRRPSLRVARNIQQHYGIPMEAWV